jgi:hypothetical protein
MRMAVGAAMSVDMLIGHALPAAGRRPDGWCASAHGDCEVVRQQP